MTGAPAQRDLAELMEHGVASGVFPGGVLLVRRAGRLVHLSCHGRRSLDPPEGPVDFGTCFDLASLTKVLATAPLVLLAVQRHGLRLDRRVATLLPHGGGQGRDEISVRMLLDHSSGLPAWRPYYQEAADQGFRLATVSARDFIRQRVASEAPDTPPGSAARYSDLNFVLLDWILEGVTGRPLDQLFREWLAEPLGLRDLFFIDLKDPASAHAVRAGRTFAATERCPWRGRTLIGEVHDDNTYAMGGVSGQAGLFGTAEAVATMAAAWLTATLGRGGPFDLSLVRGFWERSQVPGSTRTLGFDTPSPEGSQAGHGFGPRTIGHLGFTGTSLWIDPDRELIVVLLTNRVHPTRENQAIRQFRPTLHDRVAALWPVSRE